MYWMLPPNNIGSTIFTNEQIETDDLTYFNDKQNVISYSNLTEYNKIYLSIIVNSSQNQTGLNYVNILLGLWFTG